MPPNHQEEGSYRAKSSPVPLLPSQKADGRRENPLIITDNFLRFIGTRILGKGKVNIELALEEPVEISVNPLRRAVIKFPGTPDKLAPPNQILASGAFEI